MSTKCIVDQIRHYQKDIERCPENTERMMRCIQRLYVMPILVQHLQETGVGRSVNSLKKYNGQVGDAAKALVNKWKKMVAEEESDDACNPSVEKSNDSKNAPNSQGQRVDHITKPNMESDSSKAKNGLNETQHSSGRSSHKRSHSGHDDSRADKHNSRRDKHGSRARSSSKDGRSEKKQSSEKISKQKEASTKKSSSGSFEKDRCDPNKSELAVKKISKDSSRDKGQHEKQSKKSHSSKERNRNHSSENRSNSKEDDDLSPSPKKRKKSCIKERRKRLALATKQRSSSDEEASQEAESDAEQGDLDSEQDDDDSDRMDAKTSRRSDISDSNADSSDNQGPNGNSDDSVDSPTDKKSSSEKYRDSKSSSHSSSSSKLKHKESSKEHKAVKENVIKIKQEKFEGGLESRSPNIKGSPSLDKSKNKISKIKVDASGDDGIDAGSGFSFADALAGLDPSSGKKKKKSGKSDSIIIQSSSSKSQNSSSSSKSSSSKSSLNIGNPSSSSRSKELSSHSPRNSPSVLSSSSSKSNPPLKSAMPELLKKPLKLENLDLDINSTLPEIDPNYRPLPHVPENARRNSTSKIVTNDEEMFSMMMNKNQRTKVFSGGKSGIRINVPSLYELCIKVLYDNVEGLEFTGGVPFDLLKPLLEKLNPDQLFVLEHYNTYLIEDTGPMWEFHCKKDFRSAARQDMESWRELYVRCMEEREEKLKALTQNITKSIAQSTPVRKAQLAYVNSAVKPPRNVARKQAKYGTGETSGICPSLKSNAVEKREILNKAVVGASNGCVLATTTVPPPPPSSAPRAVSSMSTHVSSQSQKKRKAPLMAKTLQLMKGNRFKR